MLRFLRRLLPPTDKQVAAIFQAILREQTRRNSRLIP